MAATTGRAHAISLVALLFSAATTGFAYLSSVYSEALKNELGLSQDNIDTISMFVGAAGFLGVVPGRIADVLGSRRAIAFGGLLQSLSYSGQYVVARKTFEAVRPLYALCFLNFVSWVGVATTAAASFAALSRLYAGHQGLVVGVGNRAGQESEIPNFKGSDLGHFPLVLADFWTSDHLSERSRSVDAFFGTRARETLTLKRR